MDVYDAILARRSIRAYRDRPVEEEKIERLLRAAMAAPSACNLQPWEFIVIDDKAVLEPLRGMTGYPDYVAPLAVVFCANTKNIPWEAQTWQVDCAAAVENMMLAAVAEGLGSVWIGDIREGPIRELLDIPPEIRVMNMAYFGYPAQQKKPRTQYDESAVYRQKYDPARARTLRTMEMLYRDND